MNSKIIPKYIVGKLDNFSETVINGEVVGFSFTQVDEDVGKHCTGHVTQNNELADFRLKKDSNIGASVTGSDGEYMIDVNSGFFKVDDLEMLVVDLLSYIRGLKK